MFDLKFDLDLDLLASRSHTFGLSTPDNMGIGEVFRLPRPKEIE